MQHSRTPALLETPDLSCPQSALIDYSNMSNLDQTAAGLPDIMPKNSIEIERIGPSLCRETRLSSQTNGNGNEARGTGSLMKKEWIDGKEETRNAKREKH